MHLYEAHLPVSNTEAAYRFYTNILGLQFGHRDLSRDIIFLYAGSDRYSMLGLWGPGTTRGGNFHEHHIAFRVSLTELLTAGKQLNEAGIETRNFGGEITTEPSVIGWMPSAQLYFRDPDNHTLEFIALLDDPADPTFVGRWSEWKARRRS